MAPQYAPDAAHSWLVATVGAVALIFTLGTPFSYGIFVGPLGARYGLSEFLISSIFSLHLFAAYSLAGIIGVVATRFPPHRVLLVLGGVTFGLAPVLFLVESFFGLLVVLTILGSTLGGALIVIISVVPRWFEETRGLATGFLFVGIGLSLFILPPAWDLAFTHLGVELAFSVIIAVSAGSFVAAGLVCRPPPWVSDTSITLPGLLEWIMRLLRTRQFYFLILGFGFAFTWFYLIAGFGVSFFEHRGLSRSLASFAFGSIGGVSIFSRLGGGAVADRIGYARTYLLSLVCAVVGCLLLFLPGLHSVYVAIVFFGLSLGGVTTLYVPIVLQVYAPDKSMAVLGIFSIGFGFIALAAPPLAVMLVSGTGSFVPVISLTLGSVLVAIVFIWIGTTSA